MPALSFNPTFAQAIIDGTKRQTIRKHRKKLARIPCSDPKPGDAHYLYTGLRTGHCRKLLDAQCVKVSDIELRLDFSVSIDGKELKWSQIEQLSAKDGFNNTRAFFEFFSKHYGLPFWGLLIQWEKCEKSKSEGIPK